MAVAAAAPDNSMRAKRFKSAAPITCADLPHIHHGPVGFVVAGRAEEESLEDRGKAVIRKLHISNIQLWRHEVPIHAIFAGSTLRGFSNTGTSAIRCGSQYVWRYCLSQRNV
jgi:hypothetical protein